LIIPIFDNCKKSENLVNQSFFSVHPYLTPPFLFDFTKIYKRWFIYKRSVTFFSKKSLRKERLSYYVTGGQNGGQNSGGGQKSGHGGQKRPFSVAAVDKPLLRWN